MKAKDLMIPLQEYLKPDDTLKDAAHLLRIAQRGEEKIGVKALPVLDEGGKLIGILSMGDILKAVYPCVYVSAGTWQLHVGRDGGIICKKSRWEKGLGAHDPFGHYR